MAQAINGMQGAKLYAVASRSLDRAQAFAKEFDIPHAYGSYEDMASDPSVELVYIATPHSHHYDHMKLVLEHDKPVLCEKPFTVNAKQAREVMELANRRKLLVAEAMWTRYLPMRSMLKAVVDGNTIGDMQSLTANLGYEMTRKVRLNDPNLAGGALLDVGVYTINFSLMVLGDAVKRIDSSVLLTETGVDAQSSTTLVYDKVLAMLHSSMMANTDRRGMIYGSKGYIEVQNINNPEYIRVFDPEHKLLKELKQPQQINGFEYQVQACIDAIETGKTECPQHPHAAILKTMDIMDELRRQWNLRYPFE
jgi:predicted dehydrogenase